MVNGWIKVHRSLLDHPIWLDGPFTRGQAWVDLLLQTNHKPGHIRTANGRRISVSRGQCGMSQLTMAKRWGWSRGKVKRFLTELERGGMIIQKTVQQTGHQNTLVTICNYNGFQSDIVEGGTIGRTTDGHQTVQQTDTKRGSNKNEKNVKNEKKTKNRVFIPPTIPELHDAFKDKKCPDPMAEAQRFFDYYESNGWKVGKNKMQKWKAAVAGWVNRSNQQRESEKPAVVTAHRSMNQDEIQSQYKKLTGKSFADR